MAKKALYRNDPPKTSNNHGSTGISQGAMDDIKPCDSRGISLKTFSKDVITLPLQSTPKRAIIIRVQAREKLAVLQEIFRGRRFNNRIKKNKRRR